jgi:hypothetical protein
MVSYVNIVAIHHHMTGENSPMIFLHYYGLREMARLTNDGLLSARSFFEIGKELAKCGVALGINADEYR